MTISKVWKSALTRRGSSKSVWRSLVPSIGVFWTIPGVYMLVEPMPVPPRLAWIQGPIVAFPAMLILLHGAALIFSKRRAGIGAP